MSVVPRQESIHFTGLRDFGAFQVDISMLTTREVIAVSNVSIEQATTSKVAILPAEIHQINQQRSNSEARKKKIKLASRVIVTVLLFALLFKSFSWSELLVLLGNARRGLLLMGITIGICGVVFSAYQWRSLLSSEQIRLDLADLINLYLVGTAFSHFLPTSMGGDAVKAVYVGRQAGNTEGSASAVVMSRVTGFLGMLLVSSSVLIVWHTHFSPRVILWFALLSLLVGAMMTAALLCTMLVPRLSQGKSSKSISRIGNHKIVALVLRVGNTLIASAKRPRTICVAILFGVLFWMIASLNYYSYGIAIGITIPLYFYLVAIPLVSLITFLPISINGFGVRESAFVYLFSTIHVSAASSLLLALLMDAQMIFFGILGGCIYLAMSSKKPSIAKQA